MKINVVPTIIAIAVSLLIAYGLYSFHDSENKILLSAGSFIFLATTLIFTIGTSFDQSRKTINIRVVSGVFFLIGLISNIIFALFGLSIPSYIITHGLLLMILFLIIHFFNKLEQ